MDCPYKRVYNRLLNTNNKFLVYYFDIPVFVYYKTLVCVYSGNEANHYYSFRFPF